ncbi:MAG: hypothetical protein A3C43_11325 [Candidatus Schekmanbacteria bacterium RIFCSPHIGHO2_02_FULL_38_11]|uniref:Uncharacterized protein n=1 Tax=Candidatus Schekmanbacteria bacterium RIFCSPLOWO2_12_FULL_38_15 TaxID=1817883 RepID=A0A1F7SJR9_9BACT|nr:MAG: hypothetical protein A2043_04905 [Candidatus Schekmanbacteria bacterium GWA2_38_9]OGL51713.1 MAG: hypothetical protein A3H37_11745 [Candidatus Schekmanbacteria bacterium RIFCSPLOWO2_02_FULL_38_14]OGL52381.1 MAG: hypothetical protein A3C43_11325 [Candidatus Schekmanbacteria bacterium RIFCSPHIGHO2_02_FULL_38_11]OGL54036.1 MAG: hypothetical protein A3G31_04220 [Candidatus Schekmanbacteria bacterium RIFCSPLOWO2_12_FULL_38_15]
MQKLNIVQIISSYHLTGAATPTLALASGLQRLGHNIIFLCSSLKKNLVLDARNRGVNAQTSLSLERSANPLKILSDISRLSGIIDKNRIDIIHTHLSHDHWISMLSLFLSKTKPKIIRTIHNQKAAIKRADSRILYSGGCNAITTISEFHKSQILRNFRINDEKIKVIYGSVDTKYFNSSLSPLRIREELSIPQNSPVIGLVSRFKPGRGHDLILKVLPFLKESYPDIRLIFAGRGETLAETKRAVESRKLNQNVIFVGYRRNDLPELYAAMDILLLLGEGNDGSCRAALEAMACGKPVVAFGFGAINEIISDATNGMIARDQDIEDLKTKLLILLKDMELRIKTGKEARLTAEKYFDNEIEARAYEKLCIDLLR